MQHGMNISSFDSLIPVTYCVHYETEESQLFMLNPTTKNLLYHAAAIATP